MNITCSIINNSKITIQDFSYLDIGARGFHIDWLNHLGKKLRYHAFEPDKTECEKLNSSTKNLKGIFKYYPVALSDKIDKTKFYVTEDEACSSLYRPDKNINEYFNLRGKLNIKSELEIKTTTLNQWKINENINCIDIVKIDVQGAELDILKSGSSILDDVIAVYSEVEFIKVYENQPLFCELNNFMEQKGFLLYDIRKIKAKRKNVKEDFFTKGQLVWGDAIYLKDIRNILKELNNEEDILNKILKYIIINEYFEIMDYSVYLIEYVIENNILKKELYRAELIILKNQIVSKYSITKNLRRIDKFFLYIIKRKGINNLINYTQRITELERYSKLGIHQKYFWKE